MNNFDAAVVITDEELDLFPNKASVKGASQRDLEILYAKNQLIPTIRQEIIDSNFVPWIQGMEGIDADFGVDLIVQLVLHKRIEPAAMIGILRRHFEYEDDPAKACAKMLELAVEQDLCDYDPIANQLIILYDISEDVQERLDQFQYPLPMIVEPKQVSNNKDSGYLTIRKSLILRDNHHDDDICLDHINRMNQQKLAINPSIVAFVQNSWKNLDKKKEGEDDEEFEKRKRAFERYDAISREVIDMLTLQGEGFWLTHAYDKRGRTYAQGYHANYQGNDWNKAAIQFADAEKLNKE